MSLYTPPPSVLTASKTTIGALFHRRVPVQPQQTAVIDGDRSLNYAELDDRSNRLAQAILAMGLERGDRLALLARNCMEYIEIELAAAKAGIIVAALNWRLADRELQHSVQLVEPKLIIVQSDLAAALDRLNLPPCQRIVIGGDYENVLANAHNSYCLLYTSDAADE